MNCVCESRTLNAKLSPSRWSMQYTGISQQRQPAEEKRTAGRSDLFAIAPARWHINWSFPLHYYKNGYSALFLLREHIFQLQPHPTLIEAFFSIQRKHCRNIHRVIPDAPQRQKRFHQGTIMLNSY